MCIFIFCVWVFACMYACASHVYSAHRGQGRHWILWNWCHRWLLAMWILGTKPLQEQNVLDCWAITQEPLEVLFLFFCFETGFLCVVKAKFKLTILSQVLGFYKCAISPEKVFFFVLFLNFTIESRILQKSSTLL